MAGRSVWNQIDWDPFTTGMRNSLALNREHLRYGQEYDKAFRDMGERVEQQNLDTYLSSIPANQALAASMGQDRGEYWQNQQESILRDPQFQRLMPQTQQKILSKIREGAQTDVMNMFQRGEFEGARRVAETMGLVSPSNQYLEAIQAENPAAASQALANMNQQWRGEVDPTTGALTINNRQIPADVWMNELARRKLSQPGAASAGSIAEQNLQRQLEAQGQTRTQLDERRGEQEQARKLQAAMIAAQLSQLPETPQTREVMRMLNEIIGIQTPETQPATSGFEVIDFTPQTPLGSVFEQQSQPLSLPDLSTSSAVPPVNAAAQTPSAYKATPPGIAAMGAMVGAPTSNNPITARLQKAGRVNPLLFLPMIMSQNALDQARETREAVPSGSLIDRLKYQYGIGQ